MGNLTSKNSEKTETTSGVFQKTKKTPIRFTHGKNKKNPFLLALSAAILRKIAGARKLAPSVANGDSLPFVGPQPHSMAALKTPVASLERWIIVFKKASSLQPLSPSLFTCYQESPLPISKITSFHSA